MIIEKTKTILKYTNVEGFLYNFYRFLCKLDSTGLKEMPWFKSVEEFMDSSVEDSKKESSSDKKILSTIINKTIIPRLTGTAS